MHNNSKVSDKKMNCQ